MSKMTVRSITEKLIIALDVPDRSAALRAVDDLSGLAGLFKIGSQLFTAEGPGLVKEIADRSERIFLDLKFHDIPNTVASAARSASKLGVSIFNVHASGGGSMMRAAVDAISEEDNPQRPLILGVTVLTSMNSSTLTEVGVQADTASQAARLAELARASGLDGVVASPNEITLIREHVARDNFVILTPVVRPAWSESGDQQRIATPAEAIRLGADFLVIGRPILGASDRREAAERILEEMESAHAKRPREVGPADSHL